nr:MAG TPA: hypothetical protein [Caudoviricetes sp.]
MQSIDKLNMAEELRHMLEWTSEQKDIYNYLLSQYCDEDEAFQVVEDENYIIFDSFEKVLEDYANQEGIYIPEWLSINKVETWDNELHQYYSMIDPGAFYWQIENSRFIQLYRA